MRHKRSHWSALIDESKVENFIRDTFSDLASNRNAIDPVFVMNEIRPWVFLNGFACEGDVLLRVRKAPLEAYTGVVARPRQYYGRYELPQDHVHPHVAMKMLTDGRPELFKKD